MACQEIIDEEFSGTPRPETAPRRSSWLDRLGGWPSLSLDSWR